MPMYNPAHPGAVLRNSVEETGWTITECARRMGVARTTLVRLLNEQTRISPVMALGLERIGWITLLSGRASKPPTTWRRSGCGRKRRRSGEPRGPAKGDGH